MNRSRPVLSSARGSGSAWLIFGLAVAAFFGVLAWPKIQEASQKAKIDTVASVVRGYRLACLSYYSRKGTYPLDGQAAPEGAGEQLASGDGQVLPEQTTFGDILIREGYLATITFPVDTGVTSPAIRVLSAEVLVRRLGKGILFASAPTATRVVVLTVPNLSRESGRSLEEIFRQDKSPVSRDTPAGPQEEVLGDCRLTPVDGEGRSEAYIYLGHE